MSPSVTLTALCCLLAALSAHSQEPQYEQTGDSVVLSPDSSSVAGRITSIVWKHGADVAMKWDGREIESYRQFKDRGKLNNAAGELSITGLTTDDSGEYTAEINGKVTKQIQLKVIAPVPKPKIFRWCDKDKASCVLTCDGNTRDAEPVTYWWTKGSTGHFGRKELQITKMEDLGRRQFSCRLENPVSQKSSEPISNPLFLKCAGEQNLAAITVPVVFVIAIIATASYV